MTTEQIAKKLLEIADFLQSQGNPAKIEPAFTLPPPPPGMQWHRLDGWEEGDLPQRTRPLAKGEEASLGCSQKYNGQWVNLADAVVADSFEDHLRTRRPLTFTHAGKQWTWHRPGDPIPCDVEAYIEVIWRTFTNEEKFTTHKRKACICNWGTATTILGWRYANERKTVPLGHEDVPPGGVFRIKSSNTDPHGYCIPASVDLDGCEFPSGSGIGTLVDWEALADEWQINRPRYRDADGNPTLWEPCSKRVEA